MLPCRARFVVQRLLRAECPAPNAPLCCLSTRKPRARGAPSSAKAGQTENKKIMDSSSAAEASVRHEAAIKRNPHGDFKAVEASRPPFDTSSTFRYTQTPNPGFKLGSGANDLHRRHQGDTGPTPQHISIDPHEEGRPAIFNYKLLISAIIPRPIALVSTVSPEGVANLAPFSYFNVINHDPPLFAIGFASAASGPSAKDTVRNLRETGECVINIISEGFLEAANATSANLPRDASEWDVSGLTPSRDCVDISPRIARVREAVFSVEGKVESLREFDSRAVPGKKSGTLAIIEGVRFWVREDAINDERNLIDPAILRPMSRLGGITYSRTTEALELTRPDFEKDVGGREGYERLKDQAASAASTGGGGALPN